jgi:sigma-E factor negative regulatory protein RseA
MSTEQARERLSAFMDGEASRFEAAAAARDLGRDPELAACWERWHLIGQGLRAEPATAAARDVSTGVRAALDAEGGNSSAMRSFTGGVRARRIPLREAKTVVSRPIAAALAAGLLVVGLATLVRGPLTERPNNPPVTVESRSLQPRWQQADPAVRAQLDRLWVNHQEVLAGPRGGIAAYAAVVGYESGY